MKSLLTKLLLLLAVFNSFAQFKSKIIKIDNFKSKFVQARNIEIWLPPEYAENSKKNFPVLYMQDGQNIFNPATSFHNTSWEADDTAEKMIGQKKTKPVIIVAIWSTDESYMEYFPEKAAKNFNQADIAAIEKTKKQKNIKGKEFLGDEYLQFLVTELKPYIDKNYHTLKNTANTSICGSSMGGLISLYAICEYPDVFGQAACISTNWPLLLNNNNMGPAEAMKKYVYENLPSPLNHRIYFDYGTATQDEYYEIPQKSIDNLMKVKGYDDKSWITKKFENAAHTEKAWQERFNEVLLFLYKRENLKIKQQSKNGIPGSKQQ